MTDQAKAKRKLCWQCNKKLQASHAIIEFNGSHIAVHKTCREDAENILFHNKVTFQGFEESRDE